MHAPGFSKRPCGARREHVRGHPGIMANSADFKGIVLDDVVLGREGAKCECRNANITFHGGASPRGCQVPGATRPVPGTWGLH